MDLVGQASVRQNEAAKDDQRDSSHGYSHSAHHQCLAILRLPMARSERRRGRLGVVRTLNYLAFAPLASRAPTYGRLLWALLRDERIPTSHKAVLGLAAAYLAAPIDVIPEGIPILGALDDVAVVVIALDIFLERVPRSLLHEKLAELDIDGDELERDLRRVRRYVPRPIRAAVMRLPEALGGVAAMVRRSGLDRRFHEWLDADELRAERARPVGQPGAAQ